MVVRPLFMGGPPRSGTTALADYLNQHEALLVCRERYKHIKTRVDPGLFTLDRILDYVPQRAGGETNMPREYHEELVARKDPAKLRWIGDKFPGYVRSLKMLSENNPGARFILTYRPLEEVAESFEARSKNPDDPWLGGRDGFALGIKFWNLAMRSTQEFVESGSNPNVLIVSYHDFFYQNEAYIPVLSEFLNIEFDETVRKTWKDMTQEFEDRRRPKEPLTKEQTTLIENGKDHAAEQWILERIERQWNEPELYNQGLKSEEDIRQEFAAGIDRENARVRAVRGRATELEREITKLERQLVGERQTAEILQERNLVLSGRADKLQRSLENVKNSRSWRALERLGQLKSRVLGNG